MCRGASRARRWLDEPVAPLGVVTDAAVDRTSGRRLERHHDRTLATPAGGRVAAPVPVGPFRSSATCAPFFTAGAATLGLLAKALLGKELLAGGGEDKRLPALAAHEHLICFVTCVSLW